MTEQYWTFPARIWAPVAVLIGILVGSIVVSLISRKAPHTRRQPVEHCVLVSIGSDYRDIDCPSGLWRLYGDTLRVRLHT